MTFKPTFSGEEYRCGAVHYLLPNNFGKTIFYTYIRKNACTSFKRYMEQFITHSSEKGMIRYRGFRAKPADIQTADISLFVYRDPVSRIASCYLNKFVNKNGANDILASYAAVTGRDPSVATFQDFVDYCESGFDRVDVHLLPQKSHLLTEGYTHAIPMESLSSVMRGIIPDATSAIFSQKSNTTASGGNNAAPVALTGRTAAEFTQLVAEGYRISKKDLLTPDLERRLRALYWMDDDLIRQIGLWQNAA